MTPRRPMNDSGRAHDTSDPREGKLLYGATPTLLTQNSNGVGPAVSPGT